MTEANRAASDLEFVKQVVERREEERRRGASPRWLAMTWGLVALVGCVWNDVHPWTCWMYWAVVPALTWVLSGALAGREAMAVGEYDGETGRRAGLHYSAIFMSAVPVVCLAYAGRIDGDTMGLLFILVSGLVWYLGGVHFDGRWIVPGLVMLGCTLVLTFVRWHAWTITGVLAFLSLVASFWRRPAVGGGAAAAKAAV